MIFVEKKGLKRCFLSENYARVVYSLDSVKAHNLDSIYFP
jgi:hypothetical protein